MNHSEIVSFLWGIADLITAWDAAAAASTVKPLANLIRAPTITTPP